MRVHTEAVDGEVRVTICDRTATLSTIQAEELAADLLDLVDEADAERIAQAKTRIQEHWKNYENRKAAHSG